MTKDRHRVVITPPAFGIPFGFAGLSGTWRVVGEQWTAGVADALAAVSAVLAVGFSIPWLVQLCRRERRLWGDLGDPVTGPFVPVFAITPMLLSTTLLDWNYTLGRALVGLFALLTVASCLGVVIAWLATRLPINGYHPGFYLPTAGGTLLAAQCMTNLRWQGAAQALFFVGVASWLVLGVVTTLRLVRAPLPLALRPVVVIELAAPALATNTYLAVFDRYDGYALALSAVTVVLAAAQFALIKYYLGAPFGLPYWAAAFGYAVAATFALMWIHHEHPPAAGLWRGLAVAFATGVVVLLSVVTVRASRHGLFLDRSAAVEYAPLSPRGRSVDSHDFGDADVRSSMVTGTLVRKRPGRGPRRRTGRR
jgi:tellurite resistance protein